MQAASALLCFCACMFVVYAQQPLGEEGEICKQQNGANWTCTKVRQCPKALEGLKNGERPETCVFSGPDPVVCCEPTSTLETSLKQQKKFNTTRISMKKCEEYARSVFVKFENPLTGENELLDLCGQSEPLVKVGDDAKPRKYTHMALIGFGEKTNIEWVCVGSLISERFVLGSAHCYDQVGKGPAKWVTLGDFDLTSTEDDDDGRARSREYEILQTIVHPDFKRSKVGNDIALHKLASDVRFDEFIRPICLTELQNVTSVVRTTWELSNKGENQSILLQETNFEIIAATECNKSYSGFSSPLVNGINEYSMVCVKSKNKWDSCRDLSSPGSPLQTVLQHPYCMLGLVGVTTLTPPGLPGCPRDLPEVFTRISAFLPWIESVVWP